MLILETGGGQNIFGHDRSACFSVAGRNIEVTAESYAEYKACVAAGGKHNGVGPAQLTFWSYQDRADVEGGCWRPEVNCRIGFGILAGHLRIGDTRSAFAHYNTGKPYVPTEVGTPPNYAEKAMLLLPDWERVIEQAGTDPALA